MPTTLLRRRAPALVTAMALALALVVAVGSPIPGGAAAAAATAPFSDIGGSPFKTEIAWLVDAGITTGCGDGRFCPDQVVTREQMASFLARLLELPVAGADYFADDHASIHQGDINRLAAAGVTDGCGSGRFCPTRPVAREQMASFLVRTGRLPGAADDYFLDDERTQHAGDINRLAASGVTGGCDRARFCPGLGVTRGEMAAFLHRLTVGGGTAPAPLPNPAPLPACAYQDIVTEHTGYDEWPTTLLDPIYMLPPDYAPGDLVDTSTAGVNGGYRVRSLVVADLRAMASDARGAGVTLSIRSAYRSYAQQVETFNRWVARVGYEAALRRSARPGHSEHQLGTTIDVHETAGAYAWMARNAWRYGWVLSYPSGETARSCYIFEPWHYRYVGRAAAALIHAAGITSREYLWRMQ